MVFLFLGNILIRVEIEDGGRNANVESGWLGKEVAFCFCLYYLFFSSLVLNPRT